ncbi:hypothetical protein N184_30675 [Sinorhizobium sp. GL28]|nr:hypothetical protein N184_30675 [Sinorhizobium sp. GL28]
MCMALNTAGRPVPMFDPFLGETAGEEEALEPMGEIEGMLFGEREYSPTLGTVAVRAK